VTGEEAPALLLAGAGLPDGSRADVLLAGGRIRSVTPAGRTPPPAPGAERRDLTGHLLLPAPAEPHCHFDKVLLGTPAHGTARGGLDSAVAAWYAARPTVSRAGLRERALRASALLLAGGATAVRTHADAGTATGTALIETLTEVRGLLAGHLDLQIAVFPDLPLRGLPGAANRALLRDALDAGADAVGGAPYRDEHPEAVLDILMDTAAAYGKPLDLHTDETLDPRSDTLGALAERVLRTGFPHRVTAGHCVSLGTRPAAGAARTAALVARAGIAVVTCPQTNLYLQGREAPPPVPRGLTAIGPLLAAGVTLAAGGDNARDPFNPLGRFDPMEAASLLVLAGHLTPSAAYHAVSAAARTAMGLPVPRIEAGGPAELLAVRADGLEAAMADAGADRLVIHRGRPVCRTRRERHFAPGMPGAPGTGPLPGP
jgi:cytosine/creatinine deaminase